MCVFYSVSLCCLVYCLCVAVYLELPLGFNRIAVNKIYQYKNRRNSGAQFLLNSYLKLI